MTIISKDVAQAVHLLNQEELVAIPTETVYGLAGNIFSDKAIKAIFEMKQRPYFNPLIVHIHSLDQLAELAVAIPEKAYQLAKAFWPGPLTLVLKKQSHIPDLVTGGKDSVAIRMPNHPTTLTLLKQLNFPLAAPSANPFGAISPTTALHVEHYFATNLKMVLDGGDCQNGIESTIIGFEEEVPVLYRLGAVALSSVEEVVGTILIKNTKEEAPEAPGMLSKHYAPKTPSYLTDDVASFIQEHKEKRIGVLVFQNKPETDAIRHQEVLSETGDFNEAAHNLYAAMHRLDGLGLDLIVAERFPDIALGKSINDRLERATKR
ncbi:MAG TPA: L-threonylcarbamoyladenylate synthase [Flavobacterium sp.]|jgi:L-threonylcarbamoyladenylate synthase